MVTMLITKCLGELTTFYKIKKGLKVLTLTKVRFLAESTSSIPGKLLDAPSSSRNVGRSWFFHMVLYITLILKS